MISEEQPLAISQELQRLRESDPEIAEVMDTFEEIEHVYREALIAMGIVGTREEQVRNSADFRVSFRSPTD